MRLELDRVACGHAARAEASTSVNNINTSGISACGMTGDCCLVLLRRRVGLLCESTLSGKPSDGIVRRHQIAPPKLAKRRSNFCAARRGRQQSDRPLQLYLVEGRFPPAAQLPMARLRIEPSPLRDKSQRR